VINPKLNPLTRDQPGELKTFRQFIEVDDSINFDDFALMVKGEIQRMED
jgi:hypothetical protein